MRPYELLARFDASGNVSGVSVRTITTVNGRDYESDPQALSGASDPAFVAFAAEFSAAIVAERDQLRLDKSSLESQLDALQTEVTRTADRDKISGLLSNAIQDGLAQASRITELETQLDALLNPPLNPRHLAPFDFLALLKPEEIFALQTSADPTVVVGRARLQSIVTYIDLDNQETIGLVQYMEASGLCDVGRADQILAGEPPA